MRLLLLAMPDTVDVIDNGVRIPNPGPVSLAAICRAMKSTQMSYTKLRS